MNEKDKQIIKILEKNSRLPFSKIAESVRLSKQAVINRINTLHKNLFEYFVVVDYFKLGLKNTIIFLTLTNVDKEKIKNLEKIENIRWVASFFGEYDLGISVFYNSMTELNKILSKIQKLFFADIKTIHSYPVIENLIFSFTFEEPIRNFSHIEASDVRPIKMSDQQKNTLRYLSNDIRATYANLCKKLKVSPNTVKHNLKQLEKKKIVVGYKLLLDFNKLGYQWGYCIFNCLNNENYEKLISDLKKEGKIIMISRTVNNDLIIDYLYRHVSELKIFVDKYIKKYNFIYSSKILNLIETYKLEKYF